MQDGYRSNAYLTLSVRDNARITCEALKGMSSKQLTDLWKVTVSSLSISSPCVVLIVIFAKLPIQQDKPSKNCAYGHEYAPVPSPTLGMIHDHSDV